MRRFLLLAWVVLVSSIVHARAPELNIVTVAELEQQTLRLHNAGDGAATKTLSAIRLSERLTEARLQPLLAQMPGRQSREQLLAIADESEFLSLPSADLASGDIPGSKEQQAMLARLLEYAQQTMKRWPRFTVVRRAMRYEGTSEPVAGGLLDELAAPLGRAWVRSPAAANWECPGHPKMNRTRLAVIEKTTAPVLVRGGQEMHSMDTAGGEFACSRKMTTADEFGEVPVLLPVVLSHARIEWSHWENSPSGPVAVFRFKTVVENQQGGNADPIHIDLEGEIAFNPDSGAIRRLATTRKWRTDALDREYRVMLQYTPVTLKGDTWLLPEHRVAVYCTPFLRPRDAGKHVESTYRHYGLSESPLLEYIVDARFGDYEP